MSFGPKVAVAVALFLALLFVRHDRVCFAQSSPWAEAGDVQLRRDLELLKAEGILKGPLLSWPLAFSELSRLEESVGPRPAHVLHALARVKRASGVAQAPVHGEVRTRLASSPTLVRDFADRARENVDVRAEVAASSMAGFARVGGSVRSFQPGSDAQPDRTVGALAFHGMHLYAGYVDPFWGPGQEGSLILSNAARTFPKVGLKRMRTDPFETPVLSLLGRFRAEAFVGVLDERRDASYPLIAGMRLELEPLHNWEIGFSRTLQICGEGRPCDLNTWGKALIGVGDLDNTGSSAEPGNQLATIETRFMTSLGGLTLSLYGQVLAEDEGRFMIYRFSQLWGALSSFGVGSRGAMATLAVEATDTRTIEYLFFGPRRPGTTYFHHIYRDGYTYRGAPLGFSLDGDSRLLSLRAELIDAGDRRYEIVARAAEINAYDTATYHITEERERRAILEFATDLPMSRGSIHLAAQVQRVTRRSSSDPDFQGRLEGGYQLRF